MNKKISTLLAGVALMGAVSVNAQGPTAVVKGDFYHLQTQEIGGTPGATMNLVLTKNYLGTAADSVVAIYSGSTLAQTDSALWKLEYARDVITGVYTYEITNKAVPSARFSFAASSSTTDASFMIAGANNNNYGVNPKSSLSGSLKFAWKNPTDATGMGGIMSSYIPSKDSTLFLAVKIANDLPSVGANQNKKYEVLQVMKKGILGSVSASGAGVARPIISLKAVRADIKKLTVAELNDKLGSNKGFQLFFFHKNTLTNENNALTNVIFEAQDVAGTSATATDVKLKAKTLAPKKNKALYAYLDTISYSATTNLPNNGSRMTFKVDTLPTTNGTSVLLAQDAYTFNFYVDPSATKDSVAVFVKASYNPSTPASPRTYSDATGTFPLQIDALGGTVSDKRILTTGTARTVAATSPYAVSPALSADTRIAFTGGDLVSAPLDANKVYSVKNVNEDVADKVISGKYMIADLAGSKAYSNNVFDHVPATQFVYDGSKLINREFANVETGTLYVVDADKHLYSDFVNGDTLEVVAMADVDIEDATIGYANITKDSLTNYAFSFDYVSGILEGRSVDMKKDSSVVATVDADKLFKLVQVADLAVIAGSADIEEVAQLENKAYKIYSRDMKTILYVGNDGKLYMTGVNGAIAAALSGEEVFFLKEIENKGEYILMNEARNAKFNVNSTNEALESVALSLANNAFAVQVEKAPEYVLDAKGHYNIENLRGDMLAADAEGFGMFRKEGELKSAYKKDDFALYIDTAKIHATQPSYFILSGAKAGEGSELEGNFLRVMSDSVTANVEGYTAANGMTRLAFVPAKREATSDSLLVNYKNETLVKADSVGYKGKQAGIKQFQFKIQYTETDGQYIVENAAGYLATYNDVLCLSPKADGIEQSQLIKLTATEAPTANGDVEVSEVTVIAGEGNVTVVGAAGKKVVISNILGQPVANTVVTSDNSTIAAPQGVVVVAVEGEEAVKAIVK